MEGPRATYVSEGGYNASRSVSNDGTITMKHYLNAVMATIVPNQFR